MKLERLPELVTSATAIVVGLLFAFFFARLTGEGEMRMVLGFGILVGLGALMLGMRTKIWLLLIVCWELTGRTPLIEYPFSIRDFAVAVVLVSFLIFYALKVIRFRQKFELLDLIIYANMFYLGTVFMRNPVGSKWLGSEMVGGRPYFDIFIAFVAFWLLSRVPVDLTAIRRVPIVMLFSSALVSMGGLVLAIRPSAERYLGQIYTYFAAPLTDAPLMQDMIGRKPLLSAGGSTGMRMLCSYFSPLTFFSPLYPLRFFAMLGFMAAILFSGFRSAAFAVFVFVCLSSYFRKRYRDIIIFIVAGGLIMSFAAVGNGRLFDLPLSVQRALSFFPGNWDRDAVADAKESSRWRYEMWRTVLTEDKWIRNKLLGDGFGFTRHELSIFESKVGFIGVSNQESFLISGVYHSGPLSAMRYVGVVGLALFLPLMILLAVRFAKLIRACYRTPLFPVALFIGMPAVYAPFPFIFVAGVYDTSVADAFFAAGMLRLLTKAQQKMQSDEATKLADTQLAIRPAARLPRPVLAALPRRASASS